MDIKRKRNLLVIKIIAFGIFLPLLILIFFDPEFLSNVDIASDITKTETAKRPWTFEICLQGFCFLSVYITKSVAKVNQSGRLLLLTFVVAHIATYLFLGWIIARLVYPNKKSLPESDK